MKYMTSEQQQKLSNLLDQEEARLRKELSQVSIKDPAIPGGLQPKPADLGEDLNEEELARETMDSETNTALEFELERQLKEVLKAKEKIKTGGYGICEKCGSEISPERLEALPMTPFCQACAK